MTDHGRLTDKVTLGYYPVYAELLAGKRDAAILEIGTAYGGSLFMWHDLAPDGRIVGVNDHDSPDWPDWFAVKIVADQADSRLPELLGHEMFDLIVDDASHVGSLSAATFANLWPLVRPGGWYVLEDWPVGLPGSPYYGHYGEDSMLRLAQSFIGHLRPAREVRDMGGLVIPAGQPEDAIEARYIYGLAMLRKKTA